jgi:hypothetical protein
MPLMVAALTMLSGCFTGPINRQPNKPLIQPVDSVTRGNPASFIVTTSDPDNDALTVLWAWLPGDCPQDPVAKNWDGQLRSLPVMIDANMTLQPFCVCAIAVDNHNAINADCVPSDPRNSPPTARIKVTLPEGNPPYPLYSDIQLSGEDSFDPVDPDLTYVWTFTTRPVESTATTSACHGARCGFNADAPGTYLVSLTVSDSLNASDTEFLTLTIPADQVPCIAASDPSYLVQSVVRDPMSALAKDTTFTMIKVVDDGAPYPRNQHGITQFTWYLGHGDDPWIPQDHDFFSFTVPPKTFSPGELGRIRVEIHDDNSTNKGAIDANLLTCRDQPQCALMPGCLQRATWSVQY